MDRTDDSDDLVDKSEMEKRDYCKDMYRLLKCCFVCKKTQFVIDAFSDGSQCNFEYWCDVFKI